MEILQNFVAFSEYTNFIKNDSQHSTVSTLETNTWDRHMIIMNVGLVINLSGNDNVIGHKLAQPRSYTKGDSRKKVGWVINKKYKKVSFFVKKLENVKPLKSIETSTTSNYGKNPFFYLEFYTWGSIDAVQTSKSMKFSKLESGKSIIQYLKFNACKN